MINPLISKPPIGAYCIMDIAYCLLPITYCLLPIAYSLLPIAYCQCLLPIAYCLLPIAYCLLNIRLQAVVLGVQGLGTWAQVPGLRHRAMATRTLVNKCLARGTC